MKPELQDERAGLTLREPRGINSTSQDPVGQREAQNPKGEQGILLL